MAMMQSMQQDSVTRMSTMQAQLQAQLPDQRRELGTELENLANKQCPPVYHPRTRPEKRIARPEERDSRARAACRLSGSADQRWMCSHGGAEARREQREESATRPGGQLACLVFLPVMLGHPWLPTGVSTRAPVIHPVRVHT
jgi:hypothetical protein